MTSRSKDTLRLSNERFTGVAKDGSTIRATVDYDGGCDNETLLREGEYKSCGVQFIFSDKKVEQDIYPFEVIYRDGQARDSVTIP